MAKTASPKKPSAPQKVKPASPALHPLQRRLEGYWVSLDEENLRWEFRPKKGNTGILYAWFRDISYQKRSYTLKGKDLMALPQLKLNVKVKFNGDTMTLTEKKQILRFKRMS